MKKIFLSIAFIAILSLANKLQAQCTISQTSIIVNIHSVTADLSGGCTTVFDLTFDLVGNAGNKWSHLHLWDANAYPAIVYGNGSGPDRATLNGGSFPGPTPCLATISMDYSLGTNVVSSTYPPD